VLFLLACMLRGAAAYRDLGFWYTSD